MGLTFRRLVAGNPGVIAEPGALRYNAGGGSMRALALGIVLTSCSLALFAQSPAPAPAPKLFASAADVTALVANAKKERKADQANFIQPILQLAPYNANLEYRVAGINGNASVHEREAEMFFVVDGSGTLTTGGKLRDERRTNAENLSGSGIDGGTRRRVAKGDYIMVPENTPHWFGEIDGALVLMSIHIPRATAAGARP
jgi:mannose-6-phosphate isomerase-like protein (cupin superfamily)